MTARFILSLVSSLFLLHLFQFFPLLCSSLGSLFVSHFLSSSFLLCFASTPPPPQLTPCNPAALTQTDIDNTCSADALCQVFVCEKEGRRERGTARSYVGVTLSRSCWNSVSFLLLSKFRVVLFLALGLNHVCESHSFYMFVWLVCFFLYSYFII